MSSKSCDESFPVSARNALREERDGLKKERDSLMRVAGDLQSQLKATKEAQPADVTPDQAKKGRTTGNVEGSDETFARTANLDYHYY
jgi:hypothetical protein